ncbi:DUF1033 family protein [Priestia koreensis]|uniref:DUF1033 family protein n=1 Tax=Priestia koreensis TaxID=284581 RepID=UPI001F59914E|nr:DUF1033 family protein [Priestia koreensis]MCM3003361.1 DUF1033 family protein [Priestia koreensis]UNL86159.1 DUF1033 family protein [Priestia koreensis]
MEKGWTIYVAKEDCEPWYFLSDWQDQITSELSFDEKEAALARYVELVNEYKAQYPESKHKNYSLYSFWNKDEEVYCEACEDYLQVFHSIRLQYDGELYDVQGDDQALQYIMQSVKN